MISPTDTLMNLTAAHQGVKDVSSTLALVSTSGSEVKVVSETSLVGLLSPDLLSYSVSVTRRKSFLYCNRLAAFPSGTLTLFSSRQPCHWPLHRNQAPVEHLPKMEKCESKKKI